MPAHKDKNLFNVPDLVLNEQLLSQVIFMASPDKPVEGTVLVGDYALSEVCVSDEESKEIKKVVLHLRADPQKDFVARVMETLEATAKEQKKPAIAKIAAAIDVEFKKYLKAFFIRARRFQIIRNSTNEVVGRVIAFPDQISDDYGNNLDEHNEGGMNVVKASAAKESHEGATVYVGHGAGAGLAKIMGILKDEPSILIDESFFSEVISANFFREELPEEIQMAPRKEEEREWNILSHFVEYKNAVPLAMYQNALEAIKPVIEEMGAEREQRKEEEEEKAIADAKAKGQPLPKKSKEEEEGPSPAEQAEAYIGNRLTFNLSGVIPPAAAARAEKTGKYPVNVVSDLVLNFMSSLKPAASYPYELPPSEDAKEDD